MIRVGIVDEDTGTCFDINVETIEHLTDAMYHIKYLFNINKPKDEDPGIKVPARYQDLVDCTEKAMMEDC